MAEELSGAEGGFSAIGGRCITAVKPWPIGSLVRINRAMMPEKRRKVLLRAGLGGLGVVRRIISEFAKYSITFRIESSTGDVGKKGSTKTILIDHYLLQRAEGSESGSLESGPESGSQSSPRQLASAADILGSAPKELGRFHSGDVVDVRASDVNVHLTPSAWSVAEPVVDKPVQYGTQHSGRYGAKARRTSWRPGRITKCFEPTKRVPYHSCDIQLEDRKHHLLEQVPVEKIRSALTAWVVMDRCVNDAPAQLWTFDGGGRIFQGASAAGGGWDEDMCVATASIAKNSVVGLRPCSENHKRPQEKQGDHQQDHHHHDGLPDIGGGGNNFALTARFDQESSLQRWVRHGCTAASSQCPWWTYQSTIPACCRRHLLELMQFVLRICKRLDQKCWIAWGTLLGAVREKDHIPHETDIDMYVPAGPAFSLLRKEMKLAADLEGLPFIFDLWNTERKWEDDDRDPRRDGGEPWRLFLSHTNKLHIDLWLYDVDHDPDTGEVRAARVLFFFLLEYLYGVRRMLSPFPMYALLVPAALLAACRAFSSYCYLATPDMSSSVSFSFVRNNATIVGWPSHWNVSAAGRHCRWPRLCMGLSDPLPFAAAAVPVRRYYGRVPGQVGGVDPGRVLWANVEHPTRRYGLLWWRFPGRPRRRRERQGRGRSE